MSLNCLKPYHLYIGDEDEEITTGCGKCIPCLMKKRSDWSFRLRQEHKHSKEGSFFITLTYGDRKVPKDGLCKRHVQLFMKRLRKRVGSRLRYYCTGEYGSKFGRAHYHMLLFNIAPHEEKFIRKSWDYGYVHVGRVTVASVAYCTKYIVQPQLSVHGKTKPFAIMSRAYGIGGAYLSDIMVAWHREDNRLYCIENGVKVGLPRFYQDKIFPYKKEMDGKLYSKVNHKKVKDDLKFKREKSLILLEEKYGKDRVAEMRNAVYSKVKVKVAYSQKF